MIVQGGWSKSGFRYCSLRALSSAPQLVTENVAARYGEISWECAKKKKRLLSFIGKRTRGTSQAGKRPDASWQDLGQWSCQSWAPHRILIISISCESYQPPCPLQKKVWFML